MLKHIQITQDRRATQRGSALIVALVFLLVMTLIGTTAMQGTTQQERMAGNYLDRMMAFQAAEGVLIVARGANPPLVPNVPLLDPAGKSAAWWENDANSTQVGGYTNNPDGTGSLTNPLSLPPRYVIEKLSGISQGGYMSCRYTARSVGGSSDAQVILEAVTECD